MDRAKLSSPRMRLSYQNSSNITYDPEPGIIERARLFEASFLCAIKEYNGPMEWKIVKRAVINALLAFVYVTVVGLFMSHASKILGPKDTALTPVAVLMLLVFSAALMSILVFGQPVMWYLDGKKKAALDLLGYTMVALLLLLVLTFVALLVVR